MSSHLLQPRRFDGGDAAAKQAGGFHQFRTHQPASRFLAQMSARMPEKLDAARTQVDILVVQLVADVPEQARQQGEMQLLVARRRLVDAPLHLSRDRQQLRVHVAPFPNSAQADEVLPQQLLVLTIRQLVRGRALTPALSRVRERVCRPARDASCFAPSPSGRGQGRGLPAAALAQPLPQPQVAGKLALVVVKLGMGLIRAGLCLERSFAHVRHRQGAGNHQYLIQRSALARLQQHAPDTRVERQARQLLADLGQCIRVIHRTQFVQQLVAVGNGATLRRLDERKVLDLTQMQRLHAQDNCSQ